MGAPKGSKNALGNKGGGRKKKKQEIADIKMLYAMFFDRQDVKKITERIKTGKYSLQEALLAKAFGGEVRVLIEIFKKVFPDRIEDGRVPPEELMLKILKEYKDEKRKRLQRRRKEKGVVGEPKDPV